MGSPARARVQQRRVICVSWIRSLAETREWMLRSAGYAVTSLLGIEGLDQCSPNADLLILGHSVPPEEKLLAIQKFRQVSRSPVLSLLRPNHPKLPEADFGVESHTASDVLAAVHRILASSPDE